MSPPVLFAVAASLWLLLASGLAYWTTRWFRIQRELDRREVIHDA